MGINLKSAGIGKSRISYKMQSPHFIESGVGRAIGFTSKLQLALLGSGVLAWLGGVAAPVDEKTTQPKEVNSFRKGVGNLFSKPAKFLNSPVSEYLPAGTMEKVGETFGNTAATVGRFLGGETRAKNKLKNIQETYDWAKSHKGFEIGGMKEVPGLLDQRVRLVEQYAKDQSEANLKSLKELDAKLEQTMNTARDSFGKPSSWFDFSTKNKRAQVDKAAKRYQTAQQEHQEAKGKVSFYRDPVTAARNYAQNITGQQVVSGVIQAGFVAGQVYGTHQEIKSERTSNQQMLYDLTGKHHTKGQVFWKGMAALTGIGEQVQSPLMRKELKNYAKNTLLRTLFLGAETAALPQANRLMRKSRLGEVMGAGTAVMILSQVTSLGKSFLVKPSPFLEAYDKLHVMEHVGQPLAAADILDFVVAASPTLQKKGGHMSMNAQLIARYWETTGTSVAEMMKIANKGEQALMQVSELAHHELVVKPQRAYEMQQQATLEHQPSTKWQDMARNGMRAERGGKFTNMVTESAGAEMFRRA